MYYMLLYIIGESMKKTILLSLLSLLLFPMVVKAVTIDELKDAYKYIIDCRKEGNHEIKDVEFNYTSPSGMPGAGSGEGIVCKEGVTGEGIDLTDYMTDDTIYYYVGNKKESMKYKIREDGKVVFNSYMKVTNQTTYDEIKEIDESIEHFLGYSILAVAGGMDLGVAELYISFYEDDTRESSNPNHTYIIFDTPEAAASTPGAIYDGDFPNYAIQYAKDVFGDTEITVDDADEFNTFNMNVTYDFSDDTKYIKQYEMIIDPSSTKFTFAPSSLDLQKNSLDPTEEKPTTSNKNVNTTNNPKTGSFLAIMVPVILMISLIIIKIYNKRKIYKI